MCTQYPELTLVKKAKSLPNGLIGVSGTEGPKKTSSAVSLAPRFHGSDVLRSILGRALWIVSKVTRIYRKLRTLIRKIYLTLYVF